jgi:hypothetical protein
LVPVIVGPTGVGKTAVAAALAELQAITVISADARQVYRGLDIGTAKPTAATPQRLGMHRNIGRKLSVLDGSHGFPGGVHTDDCHLARHIAGGDGLYGAEGHLVVGGEDRFKIGMGRKNIFGNRHAEAAFAIGRLYRY